MSSTGSQLKAVAVIAGLVFGVGLGVLLVWFAVPASIPVKIILTTLILMVWPIWILFRHFRQRRASLTPGASPDVHASAQRHDKRMTLPPPQGTYDDLTRGTEEVVQWLRESRLGDAGAGDTAYALPWYLLAGPPSSGKTSLLLSSRMSFHVLPSQRASEQSVIRPTGSCDWRVTDDAVWLDTSGRYQTEAEQRDEWAALIETVKRYRKSRPLDGYVLVVNGAEVLRLSEGQIEEQAKVLRARLDEATARAGCRFPVYLVFTHVDEVDGFSEFFSAFGGEEREQVWGSTIPLARSSDAQAQFDTEFDHLYGRLLRRRMVQLGTTPASDKQLRIFKFPGRFRRARARLGHFASALFRPNPFSESPLVRGFYLTSSSGLGPVGARQLNGAQYFAPTLFSEVLLPDRNIVAAACAARGRPNLRRNLLIGAAAALGLTLLVGMAVSYFNNRSLIAAADARGRRLTESRRLTGSAAGAVPLGQELEVLEDVRQLLAQLDDHERNSPPLSLRFGLYSGAQLNSSDASNPSILRHLYFETVNERFLKPTVASVEEDLRKFVVSTGTPTAAREPGKESSGDEDYLGRHYDLLKAYLMLSRPDKVEPVFLAQVLRDYWKRPVSHDTEAIALRQLEYFAGQADKADTPHPEPDAALVAQAQDKLVAYPVVNRVYKRITSDINAAVKRPVKLSSIPNAREGNVLNGSYAVPGSFTLEGYAAMTEKLENSAAEEFRRDDWVMRAGEAAQQSFDVKRDELADIYYRDYVAHWQKFLQDIKVREYDSKEEAVRALRVLSASNSPLDVVLREVARQTKLSGSSGGFFGWVRGVFGGGTNVGSTPVEKEFRPLIFYAAGDADVSPLAEYRGQLKTVADALNNNARPVAEISKLLQSGNDTLGLRDGRQAVNDALAAKDFNASPASIAAANLMRQPLDNLSTLLVGTDFEQIAKQWQALHVKSQAFEAGFPFAAGGSDISLAALAQYLNPQDGELTRFFNERLTPYFEPDWSAKKEAADKFSPEFVQYLANARRLRDALFPDGGRAPKAEYQITLAPVADGLARVVIDGNVLSTPDKTAANFAWPGDKSGVLITLTPTDGGDVTKKFAGEWGLLRMFRETGGGDGVGTSFVLQPQAGVRLTIQPKSGNPFRRELFSALKAPKDVRPMR
jgi:type VI secretion system protein ImpL